MAQEARLGSSWVRTRYQPSKLTEPPKHKNSYAPACFGLSRESPTCHETAQARLRVRSQIRVVDHRVGRPLDSHERPVGASTGFHGRGARVWRWAQSACLEHQATPLRLFWERSSSGAVVPVRAQEAVPGVAGGSDLGSVRGSARVQAPGSVPAGARAWSPRQNRRTWESLAPSGTIPPGHHAQSCHATFWLASLEVGRPRGGRPSRSPRRVSPCRKGALPLTQPGPAGFGGVNRGGRLLGWGAQ